uniref:glycosyltransferase family 39 protein n=1 Tax=uncultured Amnibacterium sp. TaxID=1631851 RepID=UPI0035CAC582
VALQLWIHLVGYSPFAMRSFSAIGVGFGAAATVLLARRFGGARLVPVVAVVYLTVPMVTWAASEARSYAWVIALNAWAAVALLRAMRRGGRAWVLYVVVAALSVGVFIYSSLVVITHMIAVAAYPQGSRRGRLVGVVSALLALAVASPVVVLAFGQRSQVSWIGPLTPDMLRSAALQWFGDSPLYSVPAWLMIAVGIGAVLIRRSVVPDDGRRLVLSLVLPWLLLPTALLLLATAAGQPLYVSRYAAISVPALALLLGIGITAFGRRGLAGAVLLAVLTVPTFVVQRLPLANGTDWQRSASTVAEWATPGEAFYFAQTGAVLNPRSMLAAYPSDFAGLRDIAMQWNAASLGGLFDTVLPADQALVAAGRPDRVIVIADNAAPWWNSLEMQAFSAEGYKAIESSVGATTTVFLVEKQP